MRSTSRSSQLPGVVGGNQLQPVECATTVRVQNDETLLTDGPFIDAKEHLGGYLRDRAGRPRRGARDRGADPGGADGRRGRGAAVGGEVALLDDVFRDEWGRVLANLVGYLGDWDLAEECAQEAFATALRKWPESGVPDQPLAWLTTTARNRAIDRLRRPRRPRSRAAAGGGGEDAEPPPYAADSEIPDERLELIFTCCHPSLTSTPRWR